METALNTQEKTQYRIEVSFDGYFYPQERDGEDYEYRWDGDGNEVRFATRSAARAYIDSLSSQSA